MKTIFQKKVQTEGVGHSKETAINSALGNVQKKMIKEHKGLILRIEPLDIRVVEAKETTYTERFLLFFFPRKRSRYKVVLEIDVNVFLIKVEDIQFEKTDVPDNIRNMLVGHQPK
ncbi:conserved hypothetical protein EF_0831/AHA_3912 [Evansella caseinilytica]|uniref:Cytoplasmic protein n=1 Tax=Evansella caseinilytica TaxID=1503961 RepID=A0A1H3HJR9_9BACI|nr:DUF4312 family protein [Evansella caseinilytica]SDY15034.1 conserved hypothetical protein EF_0831/AHA_3912 [Evansella caseinilytica]